MGLVLRELRQRGVAAVRWVIQFFTFALRKHGTHIQLADLERYNINLEMEWSITLNTGYNADNPPEVFKAIEQLRDFNNYVIKRKK